MNDDFDFDLPAERFSSVMASEGVWIPANGEKGQKYGEFKCRLGDDDSQTYRAAAKVYAKTSAHRTKDMDALEKLIDQFVEIQLVDWRGINDKKGKAKPFTKEAARQLFNHDRYKFVPFKHLYEHSHNVMNYQEASTEEDEAGN